MAELDDETLLAFAEGEGFDELGHLMRIGTKLGLCPGVEVGIDSNKQARLFKFTFFDLSRTGTRT